MSESKESSAPVPRGKPLLVMTLMILPLILIGITKYWPSLTRLPKISSISIVPPRVLGPPAADYMAVDVPQKLREALGNLPGITILRSPTAAEVEQAKDDLPKLAGMVGADVLVLTSIDVDSGIVQLSVQLFDPRTSRVLYNNPYQSSNERYPEMVRAAGAALKRALQP